MWLADRTTSPGAAPAPVLRDLADLSGHQAGRTQPRTLQVPRADHAGLRPDQLYEEAGRRRRMMSVSAHDRIGGTPQMVRVWDALLQYAKSRPGVAFLRKDEMTRFVLQSPLTLRDSQTI